jgi:dimethylaniline monooxygenase (N-oxide forming)
MSAAVAEDFGSTGTGEGRAAGASRRVAVIGAGASGICAAKYLLEAGLDVTVYEKGSKVGGLWVYRSDSGASSSYRTLHINTAKNLTNFSDLKFDDTMQKFPDHWEVAAYLERYWRHFGVDRVTRLRTAVTSVRPAFEPGRGPSRWEVETSGGAVETFDDVVVCNGHLWSSLHVPMFRDDFKGEYLHSHDYKEPEPYIGKRVCVVGIGNSAVDIASDVCVYAERCVIVARTGVLIAPKLLFGYAFTDVTEMFMKRWIPEKVRGMLLRFLIWMIQGDNKKLGLPPVTKRTHPTSSATVVNDIAYNRVFVKNGIERIEGRTLFFSDGTSEEFDVLVAATGYRVDFPFLADELAPIENNTVPLYQRIASPEWPGLYFIGLMNPTTALNQAYEHQSIWLREFILGNAALPSKDEMYSSIAEKQAFLRKFYKETLRHTLEEEHLRYFPELKQTLRAAIARRRSGAPAVGR